MAVTWNPSDKNANLTLSNGNLTVTDDGPNAQKSVRATDSFSTGKLYWEWKVDARVGNAHCVGWCDASQPLSNHIGRSATGNGWGYHLTGRFYHNNTYTSVTAYDKDDLIMIAIDLDAGKLWVGKNGTWEGGGNPGAGTGETRDDVDATPLFPGAGSYDSSHSGTANFGASAFSYSAPSGFSSVNAAASSETTELEDASLDLSAYHQGLDDLSAFLRTHDGIELHDLPALLAAFHMTEEDFSTWLAAYFESTDDFKTSLQTWATGFKDLKTSLSLFGRKVEDFSTFLSAGKDELKDLATFLRAHDGIKMRDLITGLYVTDGVIKRDAAVKLKVIASAPVFRAITAQRVSSVISEVV